MRGWILFCMLLAGAGSGSTALASPKCSPPVRVDLGMTARLEFPNGGAWAGETGLVHFTVRNHRSFGPVRSFLTHTPVPVPGGDAQPFRLHQVSGSCYLNEFYESGNWWLPEGYYYTFHGPPVAQGEAIVCSARLEVRPAATTALHYPFHVYPRDCTSDVNHADNTVDLVIGGLPPAPVPLAGLSDRIGLAWLLLLVLVIAYAASRHARTSSRHQP